MRMVYNTRKRVGEIW